MLEQPSLPIHPQLLPEESLTSWLGRLARANVIPIREFLSSYIGEGEWRRRDFDHMGGEVLERLAIVGSVEGGQASLINTVLYNQREILVPKNSADHRSWISSIWRTRYCPVCFANDELPYLRLSWRLHLVPVCPTHRVLLYHDCWKCGKTQPILSFHSAPAEATCLRCGFPFPKAPAIRLSSCDNLIRFTSRLPYALDTDFLSTELGWPYSPLDFLQVLRFLLRYSSHHLPRDTAWSATLAGHDSKDHEITDWRMNEAATCMILEQLLRIMKAWPSKTRERIHDKIGWLSKDIHNFDFVTETKITVSGSDTDRRPIEERVTEVVERFVESDIRISRRTVSQALGIGRTRLHGSKRLWAIVTEGQETLAKRREAEVRYATRTLRQLGIPVTKPIVTVFLGRPDYCRNGLVDTCQGDK